MSPRKHVRSISVAITILVAFHVMGLTPLPAQHPSEFTNRDKAEIFIQHLVKTMRLDPTKYRAMVLEYEIGSALREISPEIAVDLDNVDFIRSSLRELYPVYHDASTALENGKIDLAAETLRNLDIKALGDRPNPYLHAYALLLEAEIDFRKERYNAVIGKCERLTREARTLLIVDHRACELIALAYNRQDETLLEFAQYALLMTDYDDLPVALKQKAEARLAVLKDEHGKPLQTVAAWMNRVEKLISREVTSDAPTQKQERSIVTALDKLIELQEAVERQACSNCGSGSCSGCGNGDPNGNQKSSNPARVSKLPDGAEGIVSLRNVARKSKGSVWGLLKDRDASRALKSFGGKLPPRYEKLLKKYYEALSKEP